MNASRQAGEVVAWLGTDIGKAVLAGALGGLVRWLTLREHWREGVAALIVGAVCAVYLGPLVEPILAPVFGAITPDKRADEFSSFVVGLGGVGLVGMMIETTRAFRRHRGEGNADAE